MNTKVINKNRINKRGIIKKAFQKFAAKPLPLKCILIFFYLFFSAAFLLHVLPFILLLNNSLKTAEEFFESPIALTAAWEFKNYVNVFSLFTFRGYVGYFEMLFNSFWICFLHIAVNVAASVFAAYVVARFRFPGKSFLYGLTLFVRTIPIFGAGPIGYKLMYSLGMINNPFLIWVAWSVAFDFTFIVLYGTFKSISQSFSEAARIDGANNLIVLIRIVLPQAMPAVIALCVNQVLGRWNDFSTSQIYLTDYPNLAYGLYVFQMESTWVANSKGILNAAVVMTALPVVILFALSQQLIIKNVSVGGLKG